MLNKKKSIHFIGICGVAMSALALAFHKKGYKVTGSDKGFYPPVSTYLKETGVSYYPGWHPELMTKDGNPDLVIVGNVAGSKNPEWLYIQENNIPYKSYPEALAEHLIQKNSIVCAGTYGKSTSASLLSWIMLENGWDPNYMFGGVGLNDIPAAVLSESDWSIVEGDEYKTARWDNRPKFAHYSPTHLLLTAVVWDHADVYPTPESYKEAFEKLVQEVSEDGLLVLSAKVTTQHPEMKNLAKCKVITYGHSEDNDYYFTNYQASTDGMTFDIVHGDQSWSASTDSLGDYLVDKMVGCFAMCHQIGMKPEDIIKSIKTFKNIKRRLEKRSDGEITVFDDIAHSPKKAEGVLRTLREVYKNKIIAIYEPNSGNRLPEAIPGYDDKFVNADTVVIPRLSRIKRAPDTPTPLNGQELAEVIKKTHKDVKFIPDDEELVEFLQKKTEKGDVVAFLGSHGFRGMIKQFVQLVSNKQNKL